MMQVFDPPHVGAEPPWIVPVTLQGERVRLEPLSLGHAEDLAVAGADPRIWEHLAHGSLTSAEVARSYIAGALRQRERDGSVPFAIIALADGRVAGSTRYLEVRPDQRGVEIGWTWHATWHWRTAVNTECKLLLLRHAFEERGALRVEFKTDIRNERSQAAIARLGAQREGVLRQHRIRLDGTLRDSVVFSITHREWPTVRERLVGALRTHRAG